QRRWAVRGGHHLVALAGETGANERLDVAVVIDDENAGHGSPPELCVTQIIDRPGVRVERTKVPGYSRGAWRTIRSDRATALRRPEAEGECQHEEADLDRD